MTQEKEAPFALRGEYITLDALLKVAGIASTGGEAKVLVQEARFASTASRKADAGVSSAEANAWRLSGRESALKPL